MGVSLGTLEPGFFFNLSNDFAQIASLLLNLIGFEILLARMCIMRMRICPFALNS